MAVTVTLAATWFADNDYGSDPTTSASFSVAVGDLLVVPFYTEGGEDTTTHDFGLPINSGTAFTWTKLIHQNTFNGTVGFYSAIASAAQTMTVTIGNNAEWNAVKNGSVVWKVTGYDPVDPFGLMGTDSASANDYAENYTAEAVNSVTIAIIGDYQEVGPLTSPDLQGYTFNQWPSFAGLASGWKVNTAAGASTYTIETTAGGTGSYNTGYLEIRAAAPVWAWDDFNRANAATWGANWAEHAPGAGTNQSIVSNAGRLSIRSTSLRAELATTTNQVTEVTFNTTVPSSNGEARAGVICATDGDTGYWLRVFGWVEGTVWLYRNGFEVANVGSAWTHGVVRFRLEKSGSTIKGYVNGVERISYTDGSPLTGNRFGLGLDFEGNTAEFDNFVGGDLSAEPVPPVFRAVRSGLFAMNTAEPVGTAEGDIVLAFASSEASATAVYTPATGFTTIYQAAALIGDETIALAVSWARRGASAVATNHAWSAGGAQRVSTIAYSGCATTGSPINAFNATEGNPYPAANSLTTTVPACMIVSFHAMLNWSATTSTDFANERLDQTEAQSIYDDGALMIPGSTGTLNITSGGAIWRNLLVALAPAGGTAPPPTGDTHAITASGTGTSTGSAAITLRSNLLITASGTGTSTGAAAITLVQLPIAPATFYAAGTLAALASGTSITATLPANTVAIRDVAVVAFWTNATSTFSTPAGWTLLGTTISNTNIAASFFYKRLTGGDANPATTTSATLSTTVGGYGRVYVWRDVGGGTTPFEDVALTGGTSASTTPATTATTTDGPSRLLVAIAAVDDDNTWSSGMPPTGWSNIGGLLSSQTGGDAMVDAIQRVVPAATTIAAVNIGTMNASDYWRVVTFAVAPARLTLTASGTGTSSGTAAITIVPGTPVEVPWANRTLVQAPRNGTFDHTISFTPATAGNLLVAIAAGSVTHTTPAGWTERATATSGSQLDVWTKTATAGESSLTTTHNASDYPVAFVVYEFPAGSAWVNATTAFSEPQDIAGPSLTGLTPGPGLLVVAASSASINGTDGVSSAVFGAPIIEDVDISWPRTVTDGYALSVGYIADYASTSFVPTRDESIHGMGDDFERITFAVVVAAASTPPLSSLTDSFDTTIDKVVKWKDTSAAVVWEAGQVKIPCTSSYWALQTGLAAGQAYDLTASSVYAKIVVPPNGNNSREVTFSVFSQGADPQNNSLRFLWQSGTLVCRKIVSSTVIDHLSTAYSATDHAWLRIREAAGTVYWDRSPDGTTWTNIASTTAPTWDMTKVAVGFGAGYWGTETASDAFVDNVNVVPAGPFTPAALPGLLGWYDASDAASFAYSSGVVVSQWNDLSGANRHLAPFGGNAPSRNVTAPSGLLALRFDDKYLLYAGSNMASGTTMTYAGVVRRDGDSGGTSGRIMSSSANAQDDWRNFSGILYDNSGDNFPAMYRDPVGLDPTVGTDVGEWCAFIGVWDGVNFTIYIDGVNQGSVASSGTFDVDNLHVGRNSYGGEGGNNSVAELCYFNTALDATQRTDLYGYLQAKWFAPSGPVTHAITASGTASSSGTATLFIAHALRTPSVVGLSTTTATMAVARAFEAVAVPGTSTTTGAMTRSVPLSATAAGLSSDSGVARVAVALVGTATGLSNTAGTLEGVSAHLLVGTSPGSSTTTGAMAVQRTLSGSVAGLSTTTAAMATADALQGSAAGLSATTGALARSVPVAGSTAASSTTTGAMAVARALVAIPPAGLSADIGSLARAVPLSGTTAGLSSTTAAGRNAVTLAGSALGASQTQGLLAGTAATPLIGSADGASTTTGAMVGARGLVGTTAGLSSTTGELRATRPLSAVAPVGASTTTGALAVARSLVGTTPGSSTTTAALSAAAGVGATSTGGSTTTGALAGMAKALNASASGTSTTAGNLTSQAPNSIAGATFGGSTTTGNLGVAMRLGTASAAGSSGGTGTVSRVVPITTLTVVGTSTATATVAVTRGLDGASSGLSAALATARVAVALIGTADGQSTVLAVMPVHHPLSGASVGIAASTGNLRSSSIYGLWNGQVFEAMQYGDKEVVDWMMISS